MLRVVTHAASAQPPVNRQRIGFLSPPATPWPEALCKALADLGYAEGRNIIIDSRWLEWDRLDQLPEAAVALVSLKVDVIVAHGGTAARAAKGSTTDIPIVFEIVIDPVATGLVPSLERPGGNVTGVTSFNPQQARKQLETLKEAIPGLEEKAMLGSAHLERRRSTRRSTNRTGAGAGMGHARRRRWPN